MSDDHPFESVPDGVTVRVKVVPGASRSRVMGMLGDRLKVAVAAPAEGGKANTELCRILADHFGLSVRNVIVTQGLTQPRKTVTLTGMSLCHAHDKLKKSSSR